MYYFCKGKRKKKIKFFMKYIRTQIYRNLDKISIIEALKISKNKYYPIKGSRKKFFFFFFFFFGF